MHQYDETAKPLVPEACAPGIIPVETIPARVVPASINVRLDIGVIVVKQGCRAEPQTGQYEMSS